MTSKPLDPRRIRTRLEQGVEVEVLDVRGNAAYHRSRERVENDRRVTARAAAALATELVPGALILTYCTCLGDGLAIRAADRLRAAGFEDAHAVERGLEGCREAGLRVVAKAGDSS